MAEFGTQNFRNEMMKKLLEDKELHESMEKKMKEWGLEDSREKFAGIFLKMRDMYNKLCEEIFDSEEERVNVMLQVVFDKIYENFMPVIKCRYYHEDLSFFEKSKVLSDRHINADQFGANKDLSVPLCAAIVELSMIDTYKSPIEKVNCLCCTYDLVFAELKSAMASMISKYSEKENEIPILNNEDVIPSLMVVIIKSKLSHLRSNLCYIRAFYYKLAERRVEHEIYCAFNIAMERLSSVDENSLEPSRDNLQNSIDLVEFMRLTSQEENTRNSRTLVDEERERILDLITTSTSEDQIFY